MKWIFLNLSDFFFPFSLKDFLHAPFLIYSTNLCRTSCLPEVFASPVRKLSRIICHQRGLILYSLSALFELRYFLVLSLSSFWNAHLIFLCVFECGHHINRPLFKHFPDTWTLVVAGIRYLLFLVSFFCVSIFFYCRQPYILPS